MAGSEASADRTALALTRCRVRVQIPRPGHRIRLPPELLQLRQMARRQRHHPRVPDDPWAAFRKSMMSQAG